MTILNKILAHKRLEVIERMKKRSLRKLEVLPGFSRRTIPLAKALLDNERTGIIAEFKRKSPSRGVLNADAMIEVVTTGYFRAGASALSVLTDKEFFGGSDKDLIRARQLNPLPILRKDFIVSEYQVVESKALGADAILLIAAALDSPEVKKLAQLANSLQLQVILEVHSAPELGKINEFISVVGVNNRDLRDFTVDIQRSVELSPLIPPDFVKISESGIHTVSAMKQLKDCGFNGFLIGEHFMREPDPVTAFAAFVKQIV